MQLKTSHILWGVVALVVLGNGDRIAGTLSASSTYQADKAAASADRKLLRQEARAAQKLSAVALDRVKAGCIPIYDEATGQADYFNAGEGVVDPITQQPVQAGFVCNSLGLTAEVIDGYIEAVVMVSPENKAEYVGYFVMQQGEF